MEGLVKMLYELSETYESVKKTIVSDLVSQFSRRPATQIQWSSNQTSIYTICCHTYPNNKFLHLSLPAKRGSGVSHGENSSCHTYPNDKLLQQNPYRRETRIINCCHTYPNDKLLQHHTILSLWSADSSCHTYPNDKLLQHLHLGLQNQKLGLSYLPKR